VAAFQPTPGPGVSSAFTPALRDLLPVADRIAGLTAWPDVWTGLEAHSEAAFARQALAGDWPPTPQPPRRELALVYRPNLDVYSGLAGFYRTRHGNLRTDGAAAVLDRGREDDDALWFGPGPLPDPADLAARYGDAAG